MSFLLALGLSVLGLITGILSGCFGIGGGVLIAPALVLLFGFSQKLATGTSLALLLPPLGIFAAYEYYKANNINIAAAAILAVFMVLGMWVGSKIALRAEDWLVKLCFGIFLITIGTFLVWSALSSKLPGNALVEKL